MKRLFSLLSTLKPLHYLLVVSVLFNLALFSICFVLLSELQETYKHYRHFRSLEIGTSKATGAAPEADAILLFGDSRIETWYPDPYSDKFTFINAGVTGETTTEMRRRFERDVLALEPDYVLIQAGVNDLTASITKGIEDPQSLVSAMHENLEFFIETLEQNDINVIVTSILPAKHLNMVRKVFWHDRLNDEIQRANEKLKTTTESLGADWVTLDPLFLDASGNPVNELYYDTLHINYEGYDVLNSYLKDYSDTL